VCSAGAISRNGATVSMETVQLCIEIDIKVRGFYADKFWERWAAGPFTWDGGVPNLVILGRIM